MSPAEATDALGVIEARFLKGEPVGAVEVGQLLQVIALLLSQLRNNTLLIAQQMQATQLLEQSNRYLTQLNQRLIAAQAPAPSITPVWSPSSNKSPNN